MARRRLKHGLLTLAAAVLAAMTFSIVPSAAAGPFVPPPTVTISSVPLSVVAPVQPQVLIAISNSNSMDSSDNITDDSTPSPGSSTLAPTSAIMTWSGYDISSPTAPKNYTVPADYTAPVTGATSGSTPYEAPIHTYSNNYTSGGSWGCLRTLPAPSTAIANPQNGVSGVPPAGSNPGWYQWPASPPLPWDPTHYWYYNGVDAGGTGGYYPDTDPGNGASVDKIPNARQWFDGTAQVIAANNNGGLSPVGAGVNPPASKPEPRLGGGGTPCYVNCGTTPTGPTGPATTYYCVIYQWTPITPQSQADTPYGDNSASRLNIAKESIAQVIQGYDSQVSFGLVTYNVTGFTPATGGTNGTWGQNNLVGYSWAYYMSPPGGFALGNFTNTYQAPSYAPGATSSAPPVITTQWVLNPCWNGYPLVYGVASYCAQIAPVLGMVWGGSAPNNLGSFKYLQVANRSDDPGVNDVFVAANAPNVFLAYGTPTAPSLAPAGISLGLPGPAVISPYTSFTLGNYNQGEPNASVPNPAGGPPATLTVPCAQAPGSGCVVVQYPSTAPKVGASGAFYVMPTNAGYVPYSSQVLFSLRGRLWQGSASATAGQLLMPVTLNPSSPTPANLNNYYSKFAAFLAPENNMARYPTDTDSIPGFTDGNGNPISYYNFYTQAIFASATQAPTAGMLSTALDSSSWPASTSNPSNCPPPRYVILITDGLPTLDLSGNTWPPPGSAAATGYGVAVTANGDGTITTNDRAVTDTINKITQLNNAGIKTFVVGLGPGVDPSLNPQAALVLQAMAVAGGTQTYIAATSPTAVAQGLGAIINKITSTNVAAVSGAVNSTGLNSGSMIYQASYTGYAPRYQDWTGDLQAFPIASDGTVSSTATWSAQCQLDTSATSGTCGPNGAPGTGRGWQARVIATCGTEPGSGCAPGSGVPFDWTDLDHNMSDALRSPGSGFPHSADAAKQRIDYLRGDTSNEVVNGGPYRNRSHILGDIADSGALYVAAPLGPYGGLSGYNQFVSSNQLRTPMIYVGANDGMLHAFNAATGREAFAFIPNGVFDNLIKLTGPAYNDNHQFFVDGTPTAGDVQFANGSWHTLLAGGLNGGGHSIYALDITNPAAVTAGASVSANEQALANDVLWEFTDPQLGLTYSQPVFALTPDTASLNADPHGFLVFFGSGYNNSDQNPYLYALNPETGKIVSRDVSQPAAPLGAINLCAAVSPDPCKHSAANGLSGITVINNAGIPGAPATTVYAGDLQGHLWKVDISSPNPANWGVTLLFTATDASGNPQPITATPVVSLNPQYPGSTGTVVYFGTGQYLGAPDLTNTRTQSFYGVLDNGATAATTLCDNSLGQASMTRCELVQQTISATNEVINGNSVTVRTITGNAVNWSTQKGWYIDLPVPGERVVTNPRLYRGEVVFTTYVPSPAASSTCAVGGQSFLMAVNYANGGAFPKPQLDINGDGQLNSQDQVNGQNAVGIGMGPVFSSAATIMSGGPQSAPTIKEITTSPEIIRRVYDGGGTPPKITWTQLVN